MSEVHRSAGSNGVPAPGTADSGPTAPAQAAGTVTLAGRRLARVGYGTMGLASAVASGRVSRDAGVRLLRHALELGVQVYDTAEFYTRGTANQLLAEAFAGRRGDVAYLTKVGAREPGRGPVPLAAAQRPEELRRQVEQNLRSLRTDRLDLVYLRRMDQMPGLIAIRPSQRVALDDQLAELVRLRDAGTIGAIGLSNVSLAQLCQALPVGIAAVSNSYGLLRRTDEPMLTLTEREGIIWAPFFPLGGAMMKHLTTVAPSRTTSANPVVVDAARALDATPSQVGLAWLLAHTPQSLVIAGTTSASHLDENVAAAALALPADTLRALDALGRGRRH